MALESLVGALFLVATATVDAEPPQEAAADAVLRGPVFGRVLDRDGKPVEGARVRLQSVVRVRGQTAGPADELSVTTDAAGRYRAAILLGRDYSVWASAVTGDGTRVSAVVQGVVARDAAELRLRERLPLESVVLRGTAAWAHRGPLRLGIAPFAIASVAVAGDGPCAVPVQPALESPQALTLLDRDGLWLGQRPLAVDEPAAGGDWIVLPPVHCALRVLDSARRPLANAEVVFDAGRRIVVAATNAQGVAEFEWMGGPVPPSHAELLVRAPWHEAGIVTVAELSADPKAPVEVTLAAGPGQYGTVFGLSGEPLAGVEILSWGRQDSYRSAPEGLRRRASPWGFERAVTDADGWFRIAAGGSASLALALVLPQSERVALREALGVTVHPLVLLCPYPSAPVNGALAATRLSELVAARFRVQHHNRAPAPAALVSVQQEWGQSFGHDHRLETVADRAGSVALLLPPSERLAIAALHDGAGDVLALRLVRAPGPQTLVDVAVELPDAVALRGRVAWDGPRDSVRVWRRIVPPPLVRQRRGLAPGRAGRLRLGPKAEPAPAAAADGSRTEGSVLATEWSMLSELLARAPIACGADGRFDLRLPCGGIAYELVVRGGQDVLEKLLPAPEVVAGSVVEVVLGR